MTVEIRAGQTWPTNANGFISILRNNDAKHIDVMFAKTGNTKTTSATSIRLGVLKDEYHAAVYGVGYNGIGNHATYENGKMTLVYSIWTAMLRRCYVKGSYPAYDGCTVAEVWHSFQNYADWYVVNYVNGYHVDKDLLVYGNKIYSPDTCLFVTQELNNLFSKGANVRGWSMCHGRYSARINIDGAFSSLGTYDTKEEAHSAYLFAKAKEIVRHALLPSTNPILVEPLFNRAEMFINKWRKQEKLDE